MLGFINIYKPSGETSSRTVQFVKRILINELGCDKKIKVGHFGTLDPDASGVLPIAIGNACRLFDFSLNKRKIYRAEIVFGKITDTLDIHGETISQVECDVTADALVKIIQSFPNEYDQVPPNISAKSIGGVRAYKLARQGVEFSIPPKRVYIYQLSLIKKLDKNVFEIEIECSSGTYIRSICRDIGDLIGIPACMGGLVRLKSGEFDSTTAVTKEEFERNPAVNLLSVDIVLDKVKRLDLDGKYLEKLKNGVVMQSNENDGLYKIYENGDVLGLATVKDKIIKITTRLR